MGITTYSGFQAQTSSEKVGLVIVEASQRLVGWSVYSGSIYSVAFSYPVITSIYESGTALTAVTSLAAVTGAGKYYLDRSAGTLYLWATGSVNPNSLYEACTFKLFFSNVSVKAAWDLSTGFEVEWLPIVSGTSEFGVELDNEDQLGFALEGSGSVEFSHFPVSSSNRSSYWASRYDKLTFENQRVLIYSWNRQLAITQAKLIYRGRIVGKSWSTEKVTFSLKDFLNEVRVPVSLSNMKAVSGARLPSALRLAKQRLLYGYVYGHRPTNYDQPIEGTPFTGTVSITNGATAVTGSGTLFLSECKVGDQIRVSGQTTNSTILYVNSDTSITLDAAFAGATVSGSVLLNMDTIIQGYPFTGTVAITNGATSVNGTSTTFLSSQASVGDVIQVRGQSQTATIKSITDESTLVLTEAFAGATVTAGTLLLYKPSNGRRWFNRVFKVAGHALREPSTTVSVATNSQQFTVTDCTDFQADDKVTIVTSAGTENATIKWVYVAGNMIRLTAPTSGNIANGAAIVRPAIQNVYLDDKLLTLTSDYTYSASNATITLGALAEFNVAATKSLDGTSITYSSASRTVTGSGTLFRKQLKPGDFIWPSGSTVYSEVLSIESDTSLTIRAVPGENRTAAGLYRSPEYYKEGTSVLSCDVMGATTDGTTSGTFIKTAPAIVSDLISRAGITDVSASTFTSAALLAPYSLGLAIPSAFDETSPPLYRDVIGDVNRSVIATLVQNEDFQLEYIVLRPKIPASPTKFQYPDLIEWSIESNAERIIKTARLNYLQKEYDPVSKSELSSQVTSTSKSGNYLAKSTKEFEVTTYLVTAQDAQIFANRFAFLHGVASSVVKLKTGLQGARLQATDKVEIEHSLLYERVGSTDKRKIAAISSIMQSITDVDISLEDLANAFSRICIITISGAANYSNSTDTLRARRGFITDSYGMMTNVAATYGRNLIW